MVNFSWIEEIGVLLGPRYLLLVECSSWATFSFGCIKFWSEWKAIKYSEMNHSNSDSKKTSSCYEVFHHYQALLGCNGPRRVCRDLWWWVGPYFAISQPQDPQLCVLPGKPFPLCRDDIGWVESGSSPHTWNTRSLLPAEESQYNTCLTNISGLLQWGWQEIIAGQWVSLPIQLILWLCEIWSLQWCLEYEMTLHRIGNVVVELPTSDCCRC